MQIFELHFNPKAKEDKFFDSFVYEPENSYERKLGSLYVLGELTNALPNNLRLLNHLSSAVKSKYYGFSPKSQERALSEGLKKANEFLAEEVKKENVSWLGNLNFSLVSIKDLDLIFSKTGDIKILLIRGGQITDIGKNLDLQEIDPYPLKVFFNIVSGKLALNDIILVVSKEIYDFFLRRNIIKKLSQLSSFNEKKIKEILPSSLFSGKEGQGPCGACLLIFLNTDPTVAKKPKEMLFQKEKTLSFFSIFHPFKKIFRPFKIKTAFLKKIAKAFEKARGTKRPSKVKTDRGKTKKGKQTAVKNKKNKLFSPIPSLKISKEYKISKNLFLVFVLSLLLLLGFVIF